MSMKTTLPPEGGPQPVPMEARPTRHLRPDPDKPAILSEDVYHNPDLVMMHSLLDRINGCTFAGLDYESVPTLTGGKGNPMQGRVVKHSKGNRIMLFTNKKSNGYENMVRRKLMDEGKNPLSFELGKLPWGTRIENSPLIMHNDNVYVQMIFLKAGDISYTLDGKPIEAEAIQGLPEDHSHRSQGLEKGNSVVVRTMKLSTIKAIRLFGEEVHPCDVKAGELHPA